MARLPLAPRGYRPERNTKVLVEEHQNVDGSTTYRISGFDVGDSDLKPEARTALRKVVDDVLRRNHYDRKRGAIEIKGTASRSRREARYTPHDFIVGGKRADATRRYLASETQNRGADCRIVVPESLGHVASKHGIFATPEEKATDRAVEITVRSAGTLGAARQYYFDPPVVPDGGDPLGKQAPNVFDDLIDVLDTVGKLRSENDVWEALKRMDPARREEFKKKLKNVWDKLKDGKTAFEWGFKGLDEVSALKQIAKFTWEGLKHWSSVARAASLSLLRTEYVDAFARTKADLVTTPNDKLAEKVNAIRMRKVVVRQGNLAAAQEIEKNVHWIETHWAEFGGRAGFVEARGLVRDRASKDAANDILNVASNRLEVAYDAWRASLRTRGDLTRWFRDHPNDPEAME